VWGEKGQGKALKEINIFINKVLLPEKERKGLERVERIVVYTHHILTSRGGVGFFSFKLTNRRPEKRRREANSTEKEIRHRGGLYRETNKRHETIRTRLLTMFLLRVLDEKRTGREAQGTNHR